MGVRPPTGGDSEPDAIEFGIAALAPAIDGAELEFPADADEVIRALDDPMVPVDASGRAVRLSTAMEEAKGGRYDSERELLNALHPVFESYRDSLSSGWLGSLRRALPF